MITSISMWMLMVRRLQTKRQSYSSSTFKHSLRKRERSAKSQFYRMPTKKRRKKITGVFSAEFLAFITYYTYNIHMYFELGRFMT